MIVVVVLVVVVVVVVQRKKKERSLWWHAPGRSLANAQILSLTLMALAKCN